MKKALAIDIGGTKISYAVINENGEIVSEIEKISTPRNIDELKCRLFELNAKYSAVDVTAVATAGAINLDNNKVTSSSMNLPAGYPELDFTAIFSKKVFIENDANAAAWAEYKLGAAKGVENTIIITIGTGIGGGVIINGKLLRGYTGQAAEVGSMRIKSTRERLCTCGNYDCWEAYASGTALATEANEAAKTSPLFEKSALNKPESQQITTYDIINGLKINDDFSREVYTTWEDYLTLGLISLTDIFNPQSIVISGGMGEFINLDKLQERINAHTIVAPVELQFAKFKNNAGMIGASLLAFQKF